MTSLHFLDATAWRAAEIRLVVPQLQFDLGGLPSGYATSAPEPAQRARDKCATSDLGTGVFAEASDLLTMAGKSLRLDLDSENETRFCRYWRETPVRLMLCVAYRPTLGAPTVVFTAECAGRIADRPAGETNRGWDRIFYPIGHDVTLAQLSPRAPEFGHNQAYLALAASL